MNDIIVHLHLGRSRRKKVKSHNYRIDLLIFTGKIIQEGEHKGNAETKNLSLNIDAANSEELTYEANRQVDLVEKVVKLLGGKVGNKTATVYLF